MIITRTPLRVSFAGGGSDLPAWTSQGNMGAVVSAAINRYIYITAGPHWMPNRLRVSYRKTEFVKKAAKLENELVRECLILMGIETGLEITSVAEIPGHGTGLGSSSSYTVGILHALARMIGTKPSAQWLASRACTVEIERAKKPIGKQDQYAAAFGGFNYIRFRNNGNVEVEPLRISKETIQKLNDHLILLYTGIKRRSNDILAEQAHNLETDKFTNEVTQKMISCAFAIRDALEYDKLDDFGHILGEAWEYKRELSDKITRPEIDRLYDKAIDAGALGGKLCGAGGGGFFVFYVPDEKKKITVLRELNLRQIKVRFGVEGSRCVWDDRGANYE
jgi:D-glycero-alpha-D-manno-heptose-7-phosphate kinase